MENYVKKNVTAFPFVLQIVPSSPRSLGNDLSHSPSAYTRVHAYLIAPLYSGSPFRTKRYQQLKKHFLLGVRISSSIFHFFL